MFCSYNSEEILVDRKSFVFANQILVGYFFTIVRKMPGVVVPMGDSRSYGSKNTMFYSYNSGEKAF